MKLRSPRERQPKERAISVLHPEADSSFMKRRSERVVEILDDRGIRGVELRGLPLILTLVVNRAILNNQKAELQQLRATSEDDYVENLGTKVFLEETYNLRRSPPSPKMIEVVVEAAVSTELIFLDLPLVAGIAYPEERTKLVDKLREHLGTITAALSTHPQNSQDPAALAACMRLLQLVPDKDLSALIEPFWDSWVAEEKRLLNLVSGYDLSTATEYARHLITVSLALEVLEADRVEIGGNGVPRLKQQPTTALEGSLPDRLVA